LTAEDDLNFLNIKDHENDEKMDDDECTRNRRPTHADSDILMMGFRLFLAFFRKRLFRGKVIFVSKEYRILSTPTVKKRDGYWKSFSGS
jgi:hypothetical protein